MNLKIFTKFIRDHYRAWCIWAAALVGVCAMYTAFYPSIGKSPEMAKALEAYPEALMKALGMEDILSPEGYLGSTVFGLLVPILLAVFSISYGVKALVADEDAGTLELIMAHPVGRISLALQRFAAVFVALMGIAVSIFAVMLALRGPADLLEVSPSHFSAIILQMMIFGIFFAALSFSIGAFTGRRGLALGLSASAAVVGYLTNSFLPQVEGLTWTKYISPFYWYLGGEPLKNGLQWGDCALMLGCSLLFVAIGVFRFDRRDLST